MSDAPPAPIVLNIDVDQIAKDRANALEIARLSNMVLVLSSELQDCRKKLAVAQAAPESTATGAEIASRIPDQLTS